MGCDIHAVIEYRAETGSLWLRDDAPLPDAFDGRSYDAFTVLAGVRRTSEETVPVISEPRGVPDDYAPHADDSWALQRPDDYNAHSHSWLSLADFETFDWRQPAQRWLLVSETTYLNWRGGERRHPGSGCRGTSGVVLTEEEYREREWADTLPGGRPYVRVRWSEPIGDLVPQLGEAVEHMRKLGSGENVRVVFAFDN